MLGSSGLNTALEREFCHEAKVLFRAMTVQPDRYRKKLINNCIRKLKINGIWNEIDVMWVMAAHDRQASKLNWKDPSLYTLTEVSSPTFTTDRGFAGNGSSSYLNTNAVESSLAKVSQNNSFTGIYSRSNTDSTESSFGANESGKGLGLVLRSTNSFAGRYHSSGAASVANTDSSGWLWARRLSSSSVEKGRNGTSLGSVSSTSTTMNTSQPFYISAINNAGSPTLFSSRQYSLALHGSANFNQLTLYNIISEYLTAIGANV